MSAQTIPVRQPSDVWDLLGSLSGLLGARAVSVLMRLSASLVAARLVAPQQMGLVAWLGIMTFYAPWLTLGVTYGAERLVPFFRGKGDVVTGERLWSHTLKSVTVSSLICLIFGAALLIAWLSRDPETAWKLYWGAFFSALVLLCLLGMTYLTAEKKFRLLQRLFLIESLFWWLFLPLVLLGVAGLRARLILATVLPLMLVWRMAKQQIRTCDMNSSELRLLIRTGLPVLTANFIMASASVVTQTLVGTMMNDLYLGYFWPAVLFLSFLRLADQCTARAILPSLAEIYGRTRRAAAVARFMLVPVACILAAAAVFALAGWAITGPAVRWLLPRYTPGIPATRILLAGIIPWAAIIPYVFFIAIGKQRWLIPIFACGLAVQLASSLWLFRAGWGLCSFSAGYVAGLLTNAILINTGVWWLVLRERRERHP